MLSGSHIVLSYVFCNNFLLTKLQSSETAILGFAQLGNPCTKQTTQCPNLLNEPALLFASSLQSLFLEASMP